MPQTRKISRKPAGPAQGVGLFATPSGTLAVQSPVRVRILSLLAERDLPFDELVRLSGKAKSTVSVHLQGLEREGIVAERQDPEDSRRKIFSLRSPHLGTISRTTPALADNAALLEELVSGPDPFRFYRLMFRTIRVSLLSSGINIDPVLQKAGYEVGERVYSSLAKSGLDEVLANLAGFWKTNSLGVLEIESTDPLVVRVYDCFECGSLPALGRPACAFDCGVLQAVFARHYRRPQRVEETACYAMGDDHCRFVIGPERQDAAAET